MYRLPDPHPQSGAVMASDALHVSAGSKDNPVVLFTGVEWDTPAQKQFRQVLRAAGGSYAREFSTAVTHVVMPCDAARNGARLTLKFLQGVAQGAFMVSDAWIDACNSAEALVDAEPFEVRGFPELHPTHGPNRSRVARARGDPRLLTGYKFFHVEERRADQLLATADLACLVHLMGGEMLPSMEAAAAVALRDPNHVFVLGTWTCAGAGVCFELCYVMLCPLCCAFTLKPPRRSRCGRDPFPRRPSRMRASGGTHDLRGVVV